eukprot:SAG22_NODE_2085_length_3032_cov_2.908285_1_plen_104_part_00
MADPAVKVERWYQQWRQNVGEKLEEVSGWGAKKCFLVGIKGTRANYCTMMEWPAFLDDLQPAIRDGHIQVDWGMISEMRIDIEQLPAAPAPTPAPQPCTDIYF